MKTFVKAGVTLTGLVLIAWPILSISVAFIDQAPKTKVGQIALYATVLAIWTYPIYWNKCRKAAYELLEDEAPGGKIAAVVFLPVLVLFAGFSTVIAYS